MLNLPTKCYFLNILGHFYPLFFNTTYRMVAFAAVSFAEGITFGAWMRALAAPAASNGEDTITAASNSWDGAARVGGLNITGVAPDGNAGFNMAYRNNADMSMSAGDEANLWVKPIDMVKVSYGKYDNGTLMGGVCLPSWDWLRPSSTIIMNDENLFMSKNGDTGLMVELTPMENLYIQAMAPITKDTEKAADTYKKLRGGFAYTVPGLVKVKGQYIGKGKSSGEAKADATESWKDKDGKTMTAPATDVEVATAIMDGATYTAGVTKGDKYDGNSDCTLEAEVDVLAVEGLFAGVGFQYNVVKDGNKAYKLNDQMRIGLGATYQVMPELKVSAIGAYKTFYKVAEVKIDPRFIAGAGFEYDLGDGLAVNGDFRYASPIKVDGKKAKNTDHMSFCVGVKKNVSSNGYIGVAFEGQTNSGNFTNTFPGETEKGDKFTWAIPVALSVSF